MVDIIHYFQTEHQRGYAPLLLQFPGTSITSARNICGIKPQITLEVRHGRLYKNRRDVGHALDIFEHLAIPSSSRENFFPAWLGFFSYEFSQYFGNPCKPHSVFPDAFFQYFTEGLFTVGENHAPPSSETSRPTPQRFAAAISEQNFKTAIYHVKDQITDGNVYQVNLTTPFELPALHQASTIEMIELYRRMRACNQSPHMGMLAHEDWWLLSGSPERLFSLHNGIIKTRPIAGTKKRGSSENEDEVLSAELRACPKENAEHAMLVDLMRNDLNKVCTPGSVHVSEDRTVEFYSHVMHLVSEVSGECLRPLSDIMAALFPGGTITGAPKTAAMASIVGLEPTPRGPYTGSLGYISSGFGCDFNILIRSVYKHQNKAWTQAGAGIVIESEPQEEWLEVNKKAQFVSDILSGRVWPRALKAPLTGPAVAQTFAPAKRTVRIAFLENQDSFSFNIVEALERLGAQVEVFTKTPPPVQAGPRFSHLVIGPGPGSPTSNPHIFDWIKKATAQNQPLLGICLGHQALGQYFGGAITRAPRPVHGTSWAITHQGEGLFAGLPSPAHFARYHSLVLQQAPADFLVDAVSDDDCIMAIRHKTKPFFGLQFHPESYLSDMGYRLLSTFLECSHG